MTSNDVLRLGDGADLPVGIDPDLPEPDRPLGGPVPDEAPERMGLGGSQEYLRDAGTRHRLDDSAYAALVRERVADLDRVDPLGAGLEPHLLPDEHLLVALDVDGTILDMEGRVSERVMGSVARLRAHGAHVVVSTGRGIQASLPVARHIGLTQGWMVCANGALTVRMDPERPGGYEVVSSVTFDPAGAIDTLREAVPDGILAVEDPDAGFRATRLFPPGELIEKQTVVSLEELRAAPATRVILRAPGMPVEEFSSLVAGSGLHSVEYAVGWTAWLDVAPEGVTKASALEALAERLGTDAAHAVAVGDGANDVEMLQWAGAGVAMGSASQHVQDAGDLVTAPVWQDGCAAVLDAIIERTRDLS